MRANVRNIFKYLWFTSVVGFTVVMLLQYRYLNDQIAYVFNIDGSPEAYISKEVVFYCSLGLVIFMGSLFIILSQLLAKVPYHKIQSPQVAVWIKTDENGLYDLLTLGMYSLGFFFNFLFIIYNILLWKANNDFHYSSTYFTWIFGMIAGAVIIWPITFYTIYKSKKIA